MRSTASHVKGVCVCDIFGEGQKRSTASRVSGVCVCSVFQEKGQMPSTASHACLGCSCMTLVFFRRAGCLLLLHVPRM